VISTLTEQAGPILVASSINHAYSTSDGQTVQTLKDISIDFMPSTFTCLVGKSGSGKSTLLRILSGLVKPSSGQVLLDKQKLTRPQRRVSVVFQRDNLMPWRTVYKNLVLPLQLAGVGRRKQHERAMRLLEITGLNGFEKTYPAELSGGMAQRVAIARGLITEPDVLLLDEPFGALDAMTREQMWQELLRILEKTRATVFMVTHSIREAIFLADRVMVLSPRPGQIMGDIAVPFERPRSLDLLTNMDFNQLEAEIRTALQ
jgi:NitT/TauT family transport system ATP-binding protein